MLWNRASAAAVIGASRAPTKPPAPAAAAGALSAPTPTTLSVESAPASAHTVVDSSPTGMPRSEARSEFSARPRMATPARVKRRKQTTPMIAKTSNSMQRTSGKPNSVL